MPAFPRFNFMTYHLVFPISSLFRAFLDPSLKCLIILATLSIISVLFALFVLGILGF